MNTHQRVPRRGRLPGEIAFDRCFLPLISLYVIEFIIGTLLEWSRAAPGPRTEAQIAAKTTAMLPPPWLAWLWIAIGLVFAGLWLRAVVSLAKAWNDPSARILRFPATVLLIPFAVAVRSLLLVPFS